MKSRTALRFTDRHETFLHREVHDLFCASEGIERQNGQRGDELRVMMQVSR